MQMRTMNTRHDTHAHSYQCQNKFEQKWKAKKQNDRKSVLRSDNFYIFFLSFAACSIRLVFGSKKFFLSLSLLLPNFWAAGLHWRTTLRRKGERIFFLWIMLGENLSEKEERETRERERERQKKLNIKIIIIKLQSSRIGIRCVCVPATQAESFW